MKILVVEDDSITLDFLAKKLREHGYAVDTSENGEDGLFKAQSWDYDAIILDVMMPGVSGLDAIRMIRADPDLLDLPVILLTARAQESDVETGFDSGADDYITKPFSPRELASRVEALLSRTT